MMQVSQPATATNTPANNAPGWLLFGVELLIVGGFVTIITKVNESAGYLLAVLLLLGYAASGNRLTEIINFLRQQGLT